MDPDIVNNAAYSGNMVQAMTSIPSMSIVVDPGEIFTSQGFYDGTNIEKKISVEVLYPDTPEENEQAEAGIESHSHNRLKRSLRLNFRSEYGDGKFDSQLFRKFFTNDATATDRFDRIILRAGNNRSWARSFSGAKTTYVIDEFARQSQIATSGHGVHGAFVHLYINGIYWGLYNPVERPDRFFQADYFGGEADDWFSRNHGGDLSGNNNRYNYLIGALKDKDMSSAVNYAELQTHLEIDPFIDYLLVTWFTGTGDWPQNNWYGGNRNSSPTLAEAPHLYYLWDAEWSWDLPHSSAQNPSPYDPWVHPDFRANDLPNKGNNKAIANLFNSAKTSSIFRKRLADRVFEHFANDGSLTDSSNLARWSGLTDSVRDAVIAESARWGDTLSPNNPRTRDGDWQTEVTAITNLMTGRGSKFIQALRDQNYYPDLDPPQFNQHGGTISLGFNLTMTNPNGSGTIRFTLDGSEVIETSPIYTTPIALTDAADVKARVFGPTETSATHQATFTLPEPPELRITEIMYHPRQPSAAEIAAGFLDQDDFEFIELRNTGTDDIDLDGMAFDDGIAHTFGSFTVSPGDFILLVSNAAAFEERYGILQEVIGSYTGNLRNSGEALRLATALGQTIHEFQYNDAWYGETDGGGFSLNIVDQNATLPSWATREAWFSGLTTDGTPASAASFSSDLDDPDGDGTPNLLELALGMNRTSSDNLLPTANLSGSALTYTFRRETAYSRIQSEVQVSSDLILWTPIPDTFVSQTGSVEIREATLVEANFPKFVRLKVTRVAD